MNPIPPFNSLEQEESCNEVVQVYEVEINGKNEDYTLPPENHESPAIQNNNEVNVSPVVDNCCQKINETTDGKIGNDGLKSKKPDIRSGCRAWGKCFSLGYLTACAPTPVTAPKNFRTFADG